MWFSLVVHLPAQTIRPTFLCLMQKRSSSSIYLKTGEIKRLSINQIKIDNDSNSNEGREPEWPNPELNACGKLSKSSKIWTEIHTLPSCFINNLQKREVSITKHFNDVFKIRRANSAFVG